MTFEHDNTNKGPRLTKLEASELREKITPELRSSKTVEIDVTLLERLVHTAEKQA